MIVGQALDAAPRGSCCYRLPTRLGANAAANSNYYQATRLGSRRKNSVRLSLIAGGYLGPMI